MAKKVKTKPTKGKEKERKNVKKGIKKEVGKRKHVKKEEKKVQERGKAGHKKPEKKPASVGKEFVIFTKSIKNYTYEGMPLGTFYSGEILKAPKEICGDLRRRGLVSKPLHTTHAYLLEIVNKGHYVVAMHINSYIPDNVKNLFKRYAIREGYIHLKDPYAKDFFLDFLRKYRIFREIYMRFFEDKRNLPIHVFLSKCRDAGLPPAFTTTMLSVLEEEGYIGRDKAEFKPFCALDSLSEKAYF
ncbi:MAG: hypothetical protein QW051_00610 [Candidatus Aenigmatarchaeota archaeon]